MLRYGYLPSDYHPMMLVLGEANDLDALAAVLVDFAGQPRTVALDALVPAHPANQAGIELRLGPAGLHHGEGEGRYVWELTPEAARAFADQVGALAAPETTAGSEQLESGCAGEIPVKVSRGEFTEDFLIATH